MSSLQLQLGFLASHGLNAVSVKADGFTKACPSAPKLKRPRQNTQLEMTQGDIVSIPEVAQDSAR